MPRRISDPGSNPRSTFYNLFCSTPTRRFSCICILYIVTSFILVYSALLYFSPGCEPCEHEPRSLFDCEPYCNRVTAEIEECERENAVLKQKPKVAVLGSGGGVGDGPLVTRPTGFDPEASPLLTRDDRAFRNVEEFAQLMKYHATAIDGHLNSDPDMLLGSDSPLDLPKECQDALVALRRCEVCDHSFKSQLGQDWHYYHNFLRNTPLALKGNEGFYVEVGAYDPKHLSNTYFLDVCLGWKGICIEADPANAKKFQNSKRTCTVVNKCVSKEAGNLQFSGGQGYMSAVKSGGSITVECDTLESILSENGVTHVDYMSIDIEGQELAAIQNTNLQDFRVDVVMVEVNRVGWDFDFEMIAQGYYRLSHLEFDDIYIRAIPMVRDTHFGSKLGPRYDRPK